MGSTSQVYQIKVQGREIAAIDDSVFLSLKWPRWYPTTADERQKDVQSLTTLVTAGCISRQTALRIIGNCYDIENVDFNNSPDHDIQDTILRDKDG